MNTNTKNLVISALFAAIACVATVVIVIPVPSTNGYLNLGDAIVLFGAFVLGPVWGAAAGGIGSAMADLLLGYAVYAPGTLIIKGSMAFLAGWLCKKLHRIGSIKAGIISGFIGASIMVSGYFLYESLLLGYGMAAAAAIPANTLQGLVGTVLGTMLVKSMQHRRSPV